MPLSRKNRRAYGKAAYRSRITRHIFRQYILSLIGLAGGMIIAFILAEFICSQFIWYDTDPLYHFLIALRDSSGAVGIVFFAAGWLLLTRHAISRATGYLDEIIVASGQLASPSESVIELSPLLQDVQNELNLAREQSLRNAMLAKEAEQRKNDLVVYLAHDLKTPLTSVIGYLTLLRDETQISKEQRAKYTGIALDKAERLEDLINEFFDITRFNLTTITLEMEQRNLTRMLEQITNEFMPILAEKKLWWDAQIEQGIEIICDADKLERVFDNLIRNAVNYSYTETDIFLSMERSQDEVIICIRNHGKTIPPQKLSHIFEQFFRLDSARSSSTGGAGLGLAIAKEIVELHGGSIWAESENESITFTVKIPTDCQKVV